VSKSYREVEAQRGSGSFHPTVLAQFRGKPCSLRRHFHMGTTLREIIALAELLAANDPERFIYIQNWGSIKRSKRSIASSLCIAEHMQILIPATRVRKNKNGAAKERHGWLVADHDKLSVVQNGDCTLAVVRKMDAPLRKRGERRWKDSADDPSAPDVTQETLRESPGDGPSAFTSAFTSAFPQEPSAFERAFTSAFESAFPDESECISDTPITLSEKDLDRADTRKEASNPLNPLNPLNPKNREEGNPLNPAQARDPNPTPSPSFSESTPRPSGQEKSAADMLVLDLACIADDVCGLFHKPQQQAVAELLARHSGAEIKELWREHWEERKNNATRKRFAVDDFLRTADKKLAAQIPELVCTENGGEQNAAC